MQRFDTRYIAFTGLVIFAYSCFMNTAMSPDYAGDQLFIPNIVRAIGQAMVLTPLTSVTTRRHRAAGRRRGLRHQQHAAQSRRRDRHRGARHRRSPSASSFTPTSSASRSTLGREEVRNRIAQTTDYFLAHGVSDPPPRISRRSSRSARP